VMRRRLLTISAIRFGEMPMAFARRRIGRKSGLDALASVVESWFTDRFNLRRSSNRPSRRRRPSMGARPKSLQVVLTRPRPAADIQDSRAGAKSPTLNVDAPTQGAVYLTSLCVGECCPFCFIRTMESAIA